VEFGERVLVGGGHLALEARALRAKNILDLD
jgi:hypothetical protein